MNIGEDRVEEINGVTFHEYIDNDIKTDIVKEEPKEADFPIKCEICNKNSDTEKVCKHYKNDWPGNVEDDKLQEPCLFPGNNLQKNSDVRTKIESTDCGISRKREDSIIKLIDTDITIKKEEYLDNPENLPMNIDLDESQTEYVKTEDDDDDIFHENDKIAKFKEEPTDNEATLSSNILEQDEISIVDVKPDFIEDSQEGFKRKIQMGDNNNFTIDEVTKKHCSSASKKLYRCTICQKTFPWNSQLIIHERTHTGERPFQCDVCSKWFSSKSQKVAHQKAHTGDIRFQCKICPKRFSRSSVFVIHQRTHTGERPFQCETCLRRFSSNSRLTYHRKLHTGERTFQCKVCSRYFTRKSQLLTHERIHTEESSFQCTFCSKSFIQLRSWQAHQRIHDVQNPNTCKVCSKAFSHSSSLAIHSRIHTGEKPFQCRYCLKPFTSRSNLVVHEKIHSVGTLYECEFCSKSFSDYFFLATHRKTHLGVKPFQCVICSKSFTVKSSLVLHQKVHERPVKCEWRPNARNEVLKQQMQNKLGQLLGKKSEKESSVEIAGAEH